MQFCILTPTPLLLAWIADHIDEQHGSLDCNPLETRSTVLFDEAGEPVVATAIDGWTKHSCDLTIASDGTKRWATKKFIVGTYNYIFNICGKSRINMITAARNEPAMRMMKALGHVQEGYHVDYFGPGLDATSWRFNRADYEKSRWFVEQTE